MNSKCLSQQVKATKPDDLSQDPNDGRREPVPINCPLTSTHMHTLSSLLDRRFNQLSHRALTKKGGFLLEESIGRQCFREMSLKIK